MMNAAALKKNLLKGICLTLILALCFLCGTAALAADSGNGSKIESVTLSWVTTGDTVTNEGVNYSKGDDHLFIATDEDSELFLKYQVDLSLSGQYDYEPGSIRIRIPAQVFHERVYDTEKTGSTNNNTTALIGSLSLSVPQAPASNDSFNWEKAGNEYILTNTQTVGATNKFMFQFTICGIQPHQIVDMSTCDPITATCEVITQNGMTLTKTSENQLTAQVDTVEQLPEANGTIKNSQFYSSVPMDMPASYFSRIGGLENAGNYAAVKWEVYVNHEGNQPFTLTLADSFSEVYYLDDQNVKHYISDAVLFLGCEPGQSENYPAESFAFAYPKDLAKNTMFIYYAVYDPDYDDQRHDPLAGKDHLITVWTAYDKSKLPGNIYPDTGLPATDPITYYFHNIALCALTEADAEFTDGSLTDEHKVTTSQDEALESYTPVSKQFNGGLTIVNKYTKDGESYEEEYPYTLNQLQNGENAELLYRVLVSNFDWDATTPITYHESEKRGKTEEELKSVTRDTSTYGQLGWSFTATDDEVFFNGSAEPMKAEDFCFSSLQLGDIDRIAFGPSEPAIQVAWGLADDGNYRLRWVYKGEECYYVDTSLPMPDILFEVRLKDSDPWIPVATAAWGADGTGAFGWKAVDGGIVTDATADGILKFDEYAGVTDYRFTVVSNRFEDGYHASTRLAGLNVEVWPTVSVRPTDKVLETVNAAVSVMTNPSVLVKNTVSLENSGWIDPATGEGSIPVPVNDDYAIANMTAAGYGAYLIKSAAYDPDTDDNVDARTATVHYTGTLHETSNLNTMEEYLRARENDAIPAETAGTYYDLLPLGMEPDLNSIRVGGKDQVTTVCTVPDYQGSGRTLLVVEADLTPDLRTMDDEAQDIEDVHSITFDGVIGYDAIRLYGDTQTNYMAFESRTEELVGGTLGTVIGLQGAPDRPDLLVNSHTPNNQDMPPEIRTLMTGLNPDSDPDEARFVYAAAPVTTTVNFKAISGVVKHVKADLDNIWTQGLNGQVQATVYEGHDYTYRINVVSGPETVTKDIYLFDSIENYVVPDDDTDPAKKYDADHTADRQGWQGDWSEKGQWRGTLKSIDLSEFVAAGVQPVLYVSTVPDLLFRDSPSGASQSEKDIIFTSESYNVTDTDYWTRVEHDANGLWTVPAELLGKVTGFAADLSTMSDGTTPYRMNPNESVSVYLHMTAPDDDRDENTWNAKGAYAHKQDSSGNPIREVDWEKATDPTNNMYAYNNTRMRCIQMDEDDVGESEPSTRTMIRNDYTRVGILPEAIRVAKVWEDDDNHDGKRPDDLLVTLKRKKIDSDTVETVTDSSGAPLVVTLNDANDWSDVFLQVDIVDENGNPWQYLFEETLADGTPIGSSWSGYTLQWNTTVAEWYRNEKKEWEKRGENATVLTNRRENETVTFAGTKTWLNDEKSPDKRPEKITLELYQDGVKIDTLTVEPDSRGNWDWDFGKEYEKYKAYDPSAGVAEEHVYTIKEQPATGYFFTNPDNGNLVNEYDPWGSLAIAKTVANAEVSPSIADAEFTFTVRLYAEQTEEQQRAGEPRTPLTDEYNYHTEQLINGTWERKTGDDKKIRHNGTVTLKANERVVIENLPAGASYRVEEKEKAGYSLTGSDQTVGTIQSRTVSTASFENTYSASGSTVLTAKKKLTGEALRNHQFKFEMAETDQDGNVLRTVSTAYSGTPANTQTSGIGNPIIGTAEITFPNLKFTEEDIGKTYYYALREVIPDPNPMSGNMTYETDSFRFEVEVSDQRGDGTLDCVVTTIGGEPWTTPTFENEYSANCKVELDLKKVLEGRTLKAGEFTFNLYRSNEKGEKCDADGTVNENADPVAQTTNDADGNVVFKDDPYDDDGPLTFTQKDLTLAYELGEEGAEPTPFYFLAEEVTGSDPTVEYTKDAILYAVRIYDNRDGSLTYTVGLQSAQSSVTPCSACDATDTWPSVQKVFMRAVGQKVNVGGSNYEYLFPVSALDQVIKDKELDLSDYVDRKPFEYDNIWKKDWIFTDSEWELIRCSTCNGLGLTGNSMTTAHIAESLNADGSIKPDNPYGIHLCEHCKGTGYESDVTFSGGPGSDNDWPDGFEIIGPITLKNVDTTISELKNDEVYLAFVAPHNKDYKYLYVVEFKGYMHLNTSGYLANESCPVCHGAKYVYGPLEIVGDIDYPVLTNTLKPGQLYLTKQMEGTYGTDDFFEFSVTLTGSDIPNRVSFTSSSKEPLSTSPKDVDNGKFTVSLKPDETLTFTDIPLGTTYKVEELVPTGTECTILESRGETGTISAKETTAAVFVNCYGSGKGNLQITKTIEGATDKAKDQEFTFELTLLDRNSQPLSGITVDQSTPAKTTDAKGKATVSLKGGETLTVENLPAGTRYTVMETGDLPGWKLKDSTNTTGKIISNETAEAEFTNTYTASGTANLSVRKLLDGRDLEEGEFSFWLYEADENWKITNTKPVQYVSNSAPDADNIGTVAFAPIPLGEEGTLHYIAEEVIPTAMMDPDVIYSTEKIRIEVPVRDKDGNGNLSVGHYEGTTWVPGPIYTVYADGTSVSGDLITNRIQPGKLSLTKAVNGTLTDEAKKATFNLKVILTHRDGTLRTESVSDDQGNTCNAEDGVFTLPLSPEAVITLVDLPDGTGYTVYEDTSAPIPGWTCDANVYTGTVKSRQKDEVTVTNTYAPTGTVLPELTKELTGETLKGNQFSFNLLDENGKVLQTARNGADGSVSFRELTFTQADIGTHIYQIAEVPTNETGYQTDDVIRTLTVTVAEDATTGDGLKATLSASAPDLSTPLLFRNTYSDTIDIPVTKIWSGDAGREELRDAVMLTLYATDSIGTETHASVTKTADLDSVNNPWNISRDDAQYNDSLSGCWYDVPLFDSDNKAYTFSVKETGCPEAYISFVSGDEKSGFTVTNRLVAASVPLSAVKTVNSEAPTEDDLFTFILADDQETPVQTVTNKKGIVAFEDLVFTKADAGKTYTYTVYEADPALSYYEKDDTVYTVEIHIEDNGNGTLKITREITDGAGNPVDTITFENKYRANGSITLEGTKTLKGRDLTKDDVFSFSVLDENDIPVASGANDATGKITFDEIDYTEKDAGQTYHYTVIENDVPAGIKSVTGDPAVYSLEAKISSNGDGTLKIETALTKDSKTFDSVSFTNTYEAEGSITLEGTKTLSGRAMTADDRFTFEVTDEKNNVVATGANNGTESITFTPVTYTLNSETSDLGEHTYTVRETSVNKNGVKSDETKRTVRVNVTDNGDGTLAATLATGGDPIAFTNTYEAEGSITLEGTKTLSGRAMTADDRFTFEVTDEKNNVVATGANNGTESITFTPIAYTLNSETSDLGEHTYTVRETSVNKNGVKSDETKRTVRVNVTDNGDGTLAATLATGGDPIAFTNTYEARGSITLEGTKALTGRAMIADDRFTFTVKEGTAIVATGANNGTGTITFDKISYTEKDIGTHTYTVTEDDTSIVGITKDPAILTVTVKVSDNGDGTLKAEITSGGDIAFVNPYTALGSLDPDAILYIDEIGKTPAANEIFEFELLDEKGNSVIRKNDTSGLVDFDEIPFTLNDVGTHIYEIREKQLVNGDYITDPNRYQFHVTVSDNGDGTLKLEKKLMKVEPDGAATTLDPDSDPVFVNLTKVSLTVHKEWQGGEEYDITLTLYADGQKVDETTSVRDPETGATVNKINYVLTRSGYAYTFSKLAPVNENGEPIEYSVKEKGISGYMQIYTNIGAYEKKTDALYDGGTVINRAVTSIRVRKVWDGINPDKRPEITLTLYCNGEETNRKPSGPDKDGWYTWYNLPATGTYYVVETSSRGTRASYSNPAPNAGVTDRAYNGGTITNTAIPVTGDSADPLLWLLLTLAAAGTGAGLFLGKRKRAH